MPLSIADIREGIAVLPNWNQNGNLEIFVVPDGCDILVLEGITSSQKLDLTQQGLDGMYWRLPLNWHFRCDIQGKPEFLDHGNTVVADDALRNISKAIDCYLRGGIVQVVITGNRGDVFNDGRKRNGFAFFRKNHLANHQNGNQSRVHAVYCYH